MPKPATESDRESLIVAVADGRDPKRLRLTAAEGYLLSRIDGRTSWRLLREIGGIPARDVDACLERWLKDGFVELRQAGAKASPARATTAATDAASAPRGAIAVPPPIDTSLLDAALDIDCATQRRILEFELSLSLPYHELLGVPVGADTKTVKRAYFKLSKEFHPDRYFRRQIGSYNQRLERIFKKVLEAHEILSDPDLCQVENRSESSTPEAVDPSTSMAAPAVAAAAAAAATANAPATAADERIAATGPSTSASAAVAKPAVHGGSGAAAEAAKPEAAKPLSKLERLKQRMPFKIDHAGLAARRGRALEIFRAAEASLAAGRLNEAEASIRIAITFDPTRAEFKEALGALRIRAAGDRAAKLLATPSDRMSEGELRDALALIEDVLPYRPHDPELNARAALVCMQLGKHADALEYVEGLLETSPDVASHHSLLGRIERARGDLAAARRAFEKALALDKEDLEARRSLASMRIAAHDAARGGAR